MTSTHTLSGSFACRKYDTWDKLLYFPSEGRRAEDFFALKNPTASAGFEPANLGAKGQHPTSRPLTLLLLLLLLLLLSRTYANCPSVSVCTRIWLISNYAASTTIGGADYVTLSGVTSTIRFVAVPLVRWQVKGKFHT